MIDKLNKWLMINCNGDWEHEYGIKIKTIDNPGWSIEIDLIYTSLSGISFSFSEKTATSFIKIEIIDDVFKAYCSFDNFDKCLSIFFDDILQNSNKEFLYEAYVPFLYKKDIFYTKVLGNLTNEMLFKVLDIPEIEAENLKSVLFDTLSSNTYEIDFPKLKINIYDTFDFDIIKLFDGSYPMLKVGRAVYEDV